ncbi:MAG: amino acid permease [Planctomycetia bacterium]|nr:amino acid permease [Planctomycetia bacterium]
MSTPQGSAPAPTGRPLLRAAQVIVISSVTFTFISYWRTAAVVLCDMSSTVYYIGAIVEQAIGKAAPWFVLAVMVFSYGMRSVYIESSALFVRGGVYRVVKEAMGGFLAKLSVSALMFDYILTGPISGVSAGQYIVGLGLELLARYSNIHLDEGTKQQLKSWGSVMIACGVTLYFFRQNLRGIHESSGKAMKIMMATTVMGVVMLIWCGVTLVAHHKTINPIPSPVPNLSLKVNVDGSKKINELTGQQEDPLGFISRVPWLANQLRNPTSMLSIIGVMGIIIAFGHSVLAMSGEETLAQVYREVEAPKLKNFEKAAFVVFMYSLLLTGTFTFLAVLLIPDKERMTTYFDNWIGGLAMNVVGPLPLRLMLNAFVVIVGFLILSGAVNTSIIGSNGVLNRVAEDGVLPDWFLRPHRRYGTTSRLLYLITGLQLFTIIASQGSVILLGEAYAFGVVWSFVFKTLSMVVLRFKDRRPREFKVPLNFHIAGREIPLGLILIFLVVFLSALANLFTKQVATVSGLAFTAAFLAVFIITERVHHKRRGGAHHEHLEQFNREMSELPTQASLGLTKPYRKLVAIRSPHNLFMLEKALAETDPENTDVVVMTAKVVPADGAVEDHTELDQYDQRLMTAVVDRAEKAGKTVVPLIVPTNNPQFVVLRTAKDIHANELIIGASNKFTAEEQLDSISLYWISLHDGQAAPLTVRILNQNRDVYLDLAGGSRIPTFSARRARSVAELRAAGVGVDRVLLAHDGTQAGSDLCHSALTMLDPAVALGVIAVPAHEEHAHSQHAHTGQGTLEHDLDQATHLDRPMEVHQVAGIDLGTEIIQLAKELHYDLIILPLSEHGHTTGARPPRPAWVDYVLTHAHCQVFLAGAPLISREVEEATPLASGAH